MKTNKTTTILQSEWLLQYAMRLTQRQQFSLSTKNTWWWRKKIIVHQLQNGTYEFSNLTHFEKENRILTIWKNEDQIVLTAISMILRCFAKRHVPKNARI